mgnify:CR=1 FL=1
MLPNKRILVAVDSSENGLRALSRARLIAEHLGCALELLWIGDMPAWQGVSEELRALEESGVYWVTLDLTESLEKFVAKRWQSDHFSMLVKGCDVSHDQPSLLAPMDWRLLRETPCPVLLVKNPERWAGGKVLAAINPLSRKEAMDRHNQTVMMVSGFLSSQIGAELHTVSAAPSPMLGADAEMQVPMLIERRTRQAVDKLVEQMCIEPVANHVGEGPPHFLIPNVANDIEASLVVIGTHARTGLTGALLGNTAEQILDRLDTDILVLRASLPNEVREVMGN